MAVLQWGRWVIPALLAAAVAAFRCGSDVSWAPSEAAMERKGLTLDDTTFRYCPSKIPAIWPNSAEAVTSLRLFKAWDPRWPEEERRPAWGRLADFAAATGAKLFLGTQITCDERQDEQDWAWVKELLSTLSCEQVMGLSVGNEVDLLYRKGHVDASVTPSCIGNLWEGGHLWRQLTRRVSELDALGFACVPVTSVLSGAGLGGEPFLEQPGNALVASFLANASRLYGRRFVFAFNFYPYFDPNYQLDPQGFRQCSGALGMATCWDRQCALPSMAALTRVRLTQLTGKADSLFWIGETGWSAPRASSLGSAMAVCRAWSSPAVFAEYYRGFLGWNLEVGDVRPPDHVFFFALRDSTNFGVGEFFGLVHSCEEDACKVRGAGFAARARSGSSGRLPWLQWAWFILGSAVLTTAASASTCLELRRRRLLVHQASGSEAASASPPLHAGDLGPRRADVPEGEALQAACSTPLAAASGYRAAVHRSRE